MDEAIPGFANLLRAHRRRAGLSQEELAERAGVSAKAIGALEQGKRRAPYDTTLALLIEALGLDDLSRAAFEGAAIRARTSARVDDEVAQPTARGDNLPAQVNRFVGRERELEDLARLLRAHRLLTVTGSGGFGKTRLVLEAAFRKKGEYADGAWLVELASVSDGPSVLAKVASSLCLRVANHDPLQNLALRLSSRHLLLILDNCEHVLDFVRPLVSLIMRECPRVVILATSRERLALSGEVTFRIPTLAIPSATDDSSASEVGAHAAVALFVNRAQMADPHFVLTDARAPAVADICRRLEGIPLAIEIAAARLHQFGLLNLRRKLDDRLNPLTNPFVDLPSRQRTLEAMLDWSYGLLDDAGRSVFRRLSVFPRGCSIEAARTVLCDERFSASTIDNVLDALVDKSLVVVSEENGRLRYSLLESTRVFAAELLAASEDAAETSRRLIGWAETFAEEMHRERFRISDSLYFSIAAAEFDNVYAALFAALQHDGDVLAAANIVGSLHVYWHDFGRGEALRIAQDVLGRLDVGVYPGSAASIHLGRANLLSGSERLSAVLAARDALRDSDDALRKMHCFLHLAWAYVIVGQATGAFQALDAAWAFAVAAGFDNAHVIAQISYFRAGALERQGRIRLARESYASSAAEAASCEDRVSEAWSRAAYAEMLFCEGDAAEALSLLEELIRGAARYGALHVLLHLKAAGCRIVLGDMEGAADAALFALRAADGYVPYIVEAMERVAHVLSVRGESVRAARLLGYADARIVEGGYPRGAFNALCRAALAHNLRKSISDDDLQVHFAYGERMSLDEATSECCRDARMETVGADRKPRTDSKIPS